MQLDETNHYAHMAKPIAIALGVIGLAFSASACDEIGSEFSGCEDYSSIATSGEVRERLEVWARLNFEGEIINLDSLPADYSLSSGPGDVQFENRETLEFLPGRGRNEWIQLDLDSAGEVMAVFIGRSGRAGLVVFLTDDIEPTFLRRALTAEYGPVAVYCND